MIDILLTDKFFRDSPDAGMPECLCSRCGEEIPEDAIPIRVFADCGCSGEYRFHPSCVGLAGEGEAPR